MKKRILLLCFLLMLLLSGCTRRTYTVTFDPNGGEVLSGRRVQKVAPGESAEAPTVYRRGLPVKWDRDFSAVNENMTVTAVWEDITHTVTFDPCGGELISGELTVTVQDGADAPLPTLYRGGMDCVWEEGYLHVTEDRVVSARWEARPLGKDELEARLRECTAEVSAVTFYSASRSGSGFFIHADGTLLTSFRVIEMAERISVKLPDGTLCPVESVIYTDPGRDVAVLKISREPGAFLTLPEGDSAGEGALYTLSGGALTPVQLSGGENGMLRCDSETGSSGGAVIDESGAAAGMLGSTVSASETRPVIPADAFRGFPTDGAKTMAEAAAEFRQTSAQSYSPRDEDGSYHYSLLRTYQSVTGSPCLYSVNSDGQVEGYADCSGNYVYALKEEELSAYTAYLESQGYVFRGEERFDEGSSAYYYNEMDGILVDLFRTNGTELWIWVTE